MNSSNPHPYNQTTLRSTIACVIAAIVCGTTAEAALIYQEGFNYGAVSGSLDGENGGTGFSGAWTSGNAGITYSSSGLSFSDLVVSGGSVTATGTNGIGNALFYRPLSNTLSGVYYGSFLSQVVNVNSSLFAIENGMALGPQNTFPSFGGFGILAPLNDNALAVVAASELVANGSMLNYLTYLTLFKIDTAAIMTTGWLLSAGQYDIFKGGGITEAELNSAAIGTGTSELRARASVTDIGSVTASHLNIFMNAAFGVSATLAADEFRLSDMSLNEVIPAVPEPGSVALLIALGIGLFVRFIRKRRIRNA